MNAFALIIIAAGFITAAAAATALTLKYRSFSGVTEGETLSPAEEDRSALIVIDVQEGLCGSCSPWYFRGYAKQSEELIAALNEAVKIAYRSGLTVLYITHEDTDPVVKFITGSRMTPGKAASSVDKRVKIVSDSHFTKNIMDGFSNPDLENSLRKNKINNIYITGLDAAYCVYRTALAARKRGYNVNLISDAVISSTLKKKNKMLKKYSNNGIRILSLNDFKRIFNINPDK